MHGRVFFSSRSFPFSFLKGVDEVGGGVTVERLKREEFIPYDLKSQQKVDFLFLRSWACKNSIVAHSSCVDMTLARLQRRSRLCSGIFECVFNAW